MVIKPNAWGLERAMERPENVFSVSGIYGTDFCGSEWYRAGDGVGGGGEVHAWALVESPRLPNKVDNGLIKRAKRSVNPWAGKSVGTADTWGQSSGWN